MAKTVLVIGIGTGIKFHIIDNKTCNKSLCGREIDMFGTRIAKQMSIKDNRICNSCWLTEALKHHRR